MWAPGRAGRERAPAHRAFEQLRTGEVKEITGANPLVDFLVEETLDLAAAHDLVVAVHAGMWGDFRTLDAHHMIPVFPLGDYKVHSAIAGKGEGR